MPAWDGALGGWWYERDELSQEQGEGPDVKQTREEEVSALFADDPSPALLAAGQCFLDARQQVAELERQLAGARRRLAMQESLLWTQMEAAGLKRLQCGSVPLVATHRTHYSLPAGALDEPTVFGWALMHGAAKLIKRWADPRTFSAWCRELAAKGVALHPRVKFVTLKSVRVEGEREDGTP